MKKRVIACVLALAMTAGLLGGCGSSGASDTDSQTTGDSSGDQIDLSMFWWGSQLRNERTQEVLDMYMEDNPNVTIEGQFSDDYWTRMATFAAGHTMPDVVQMVYAYMPQYAREGTLLDLTPYIEDGTIDMSNVNEEILNTGKVEDGIYGICNGINASALLYNKTLLDDAGIEIKDYMTMDDFINICREVYEKTGYKTSLSYGAMTSESYMQFVLRVQGKTLYGDGAIGVDSADQLEPFFDLYETGLEEGWLLDPSLYVERVRGQVEQDPIVYGSSPETMSWCGFYASNQLTSMQSAAPEGVEIGITTFPSDDIETAEWLNPSQFFSISADCENPDEAAKLINYLINDIDCNNVLLGERGVPISSVVSEAISENISEDDQKVVTFINDVVTPKSSAIDPPYPDQSSEIVSLLDSITEKVMYGELTAQDAAEQFLEEGNAILAGN